MCVCLPVCLCLAFRGWHRDESSSAAPTDRVFGGWINCGKEDTEFTCAPGSQREKRGTGGFVKIKDGTPYDAKCRRIRVPPGYQVIFVEHIVHKVTAAATKAMDLRLFMGWRLTDATTPLFDDIEERLDDQGIVRIKSGQMPPMHAALHWTNHRDMLVDFSVQFKDVCTITRAVLSGSNEGKTYRVVPRYMPSLKALKLPMFKAYSKEEKTLYTPNCKWPILGADVCLPRKKRDASSSVPPPPPQRLRLATPTAATDTAPPQRLETAPAATDMYGLGALIRRVPSVKVQAKYLAETADVVRRDVFGGEKNPTRITADDVRKCIEIIVCLSLGGFGSHIPLTTKLNRAGTVKKAGHCCGDEIAFNAALVFAYVAVVNGEIGPRNVNGKVCRSIVAILICVMEHEIIHWLMQHYVPREVRKGRGRWSSHGTVFKDIARNIFGHTTCKTALSTEVTARSLTQETTKEGQKVMVTFRKLGSRPGVVTKVNPTLAKVSVTEPDGKKRTYDVPYTIMQRADV